MIGDVIHGQTLKKEMEGHCHESVTVWVNVVHYFFALHN